MFSINASGQDAQKTGGAGSKDGSGRGSGANGRQRRSNNTTYASPSTPKAGAAAAGGHGSSGPSTVVVVMPAVAQGHGSVAGMAGSSAPPSPAGGLGATSTSTPRCSKLDLTVGVEEHCSLSQRLVANTAWMQLAPSTAVARTVAPAPVKGTSAAVAAAQQLQRWVRRLQAEARQAARARAQAPGHLMPLLEAAAGLGAGPWGCEWEALCSEERGLGAHAGGLLVSLGLPSGAEEAQQQQQQQQLELPFSLVQSEALLSALLIAAHPEVVTSHMARRAKRSLKHRHQQRREEETAAEHEQRRRRRRQARAHMKKGEGLAAAALTVRDALLTLQRALSLDCVEDRVPCWAMARAAQQAARAVVAFVVRREHCRAAAAAETARLADELTGAAAEALEAVGRGEQEEVGLAAMARLGEVEQGLVRLVGAEEAQGRLDAARAAAQARLQHGGECAAAAAAAAAAMASAMEVEAALGEGAVSAEQQLQEQQQEQQQQQGVEDGPGAAAVAAAAAAAAAAGAGCPESLFSNAWLIHEICVLPPGRFLQVSLEDAGNGYGNGNGQQAYTVHAMSGAAGAGAGGSGGGAAASSADAEAYWASVTRTLLAGDATPLLVLVQELSERLVSITPSRQDLAAEVAEALDLALLEQALARDVLDSRLLFSMLRFAGERILWLEAPARNESTQAWLAQLAELEAQVLGRASGGAVHLSLAHEAAAAAGAEAASAAAAVAGVGEWAGLVSPLFEFLLEKVDQIHVDIFNSHVRRATPHCRAHGPAFERQRFEERVAAGQASLARTREWLACVLASEWGAQQALPVPGGAHKQQQQQQLVSLSLVDGLKANRGDALKLLLRRAYAALLCQHEQPQQPAHEAPAVPEPLAMDAHRLQLARHGLLCIARAAACAAYLAQALGRPLTAAERAGALKELMVLLPVDAEGEGEGEGEGGEAVVAEGVSLQAGALALRFGAGPQAASLLEARVARMLATGDCPVLRIVYARAVDALHHVLALDGAKEADGGAGFAKECGTKGLGGLEPWVRKVGEVLLLVCRHNEAAFATLYHAVAVEVVTEQAQGQATAMEL